jgi:hypothetical protein
MLRTVKAASADYCAEACKNACIQLLSLVSANYMIVNLIKC